MIKVHLTMNACSGGLLMNIFLMYLECNNHKYIFYYYIEVHLTINACSGELAMNILIEYS